MEPLPAPGAQAPRPLSIAPLKGSGAWGSDHRAIGAMMNAIRYDKHSLRPSILPLTGAEKRAA